MLNMSLVKVPFHFFFYFIADLFFHIGLARCDHTSFFHVQFFLGGELGLPIAFKGTHVLVDDLTHSFLEEVSNNTSCGFAIKHGSVFICFWPSSDFSLGVFVDPLEETTLALGALEEEPV